MSGDTIDISTTVDGEDVAVGTWYPHPRSGGIFRYDESWVSTEYGYSLSPALPVLAGSASQVTYAEKGKLPQIFSDSAPDRWGQQIIKRTWQAEGKGVPNEVDILLAVSDRLRMGALRFSRDGVVMSESARVPKMLDLAHLEAVAHRAERHTDSDEDIQDLSDAGSSLGGARPKVVVVDENGHLMLAKFTSTKDDTEVIAWEKVCLDIAARAGITVPRSRLMRLESHPVLVLDRFDREYDTAGTETRIGYISAMTMLNESDGGSSSMVAVAEAFEPHMAASGYADLAELWTRSALNLLVGNKDNHLRNHGFLRQRDGWRLSPVFDVTPAASKTEYALPLDEGLPDTIDTLLDIAAIFGLEDDEARDRLALVASAVDEWQSLARHYRIPPHHDRSVRDGFAGEMRQQTREALGDRPAPVVLDLSPSGSAGGTSARCHVCGRPLRSPESIARGAGLECAKKM